MNIISKGGVRVPKRYVPKHLSKKDKKKQAKELKKSRRAYKKGKYYQRKKVKSFKRKESRHIKKAKKMYKIKSLKINKTLARKTGCKTRGLRKIVAKGKGAYYSSGSRPNQSAHSWGYARLGSSITGGKASAVDYKILKKYCSKKSKALKLANKMKGKGTRRVKKVKIGGKKPLPRVREVVNLGWRVNRHGLDPTPAENEQLREQVEADNAFANATTEFGDEDDDEEDLMEYTAVPPLEYVDRHQRLIDSMMRRSEERQEEFRRDQESALYDRTIFMTRDEIEQEADDFWNDINDIVYIEDVDDETEHILSNDEINRFNIQDNETLLNTIHYNHFSLWRIIARELVTNDFPNYTLQSVDDTNIEIIRPQYKIYDDVEGYLREARERHQFWFGTGGRRKKKRKTRRVKKVKIGGGKKYKKCLGKKNGVDGCRKCCNKKYTRRSYKKCVKRCMKHKPRKWSRKYKKSINCKKPKGFSQRQYCKYGRKN